MVTAKCERERLVREWKRTHPNGEPCPRKPASGGRTGRPGNLNQDSNINVTDETRAYRRAAIEALRAKEAAWGQKRRVA